MTDTKIRRSRFIDMSKSLFYDQRGFFAETYSHQRYVEMGIDVDFVQDNHSISRDVGTVRGLHFQAPPYAQAKIGALRAWRCF